MMSGKKSIRKNFMMNAVLTASRLVFPLLTYPVVLRALGPGGMGRAGFAISLASGVSVLSQLGIPVYGVRACARARDSREELSRVAAELFMLSAAFGMAAFALYSLAAAAVPRLREGQGLHMVAASVILLDAIGMEWLYKGLEEYGWITLRSLLCRAAAAALMLLLIRSEADCLAYVGLMVLAPGLSAIWNLIRSGRYVDRVLPRLLDVQGHIRPALTFFAMDCATAVYTNLDTAMLGFMATDADIGCYHAASRIKAVLVGIVTSLGAVLLPRASWYAGKGMKKEFMGLVRKALLWVLIFSIPAAAVSWLMAGTVIGLIAGPGFEGAVLPMKVLMLTLPLIGITNVLGIQMMVPLGRERTVLFSVAAGAVTDLALNLILIPAYGAAGAAVGTLIAEISVAAVQAVSAAGIVKEMRSDK